MDVKREALTLGLAALLLACGAAHADPPDLLDVLHANHAITDAQYAQLKQAAAQHSGAAPAPRLLDVLHANHVITDKQYAELAATPREQVATAPSNPAPAGDASTGPHLPKIDGYLQYDVPLSVDHANRLGSRTNLRRFYVHIHDTIAPDWSYSTTFGYFNGATYFASGDITYTGFRNTTVTGGYFKEPFSMSYLTSPANLLFPERPLPVQALVPGKQIGVAVGRHGPRWTLSGGVFGGSYNQTAANPEGVAGRWGGSVRGTFVPWMSGDSLWAIGASAAWREADSNHSIAFGYLPESFTVGTRFANTPKITGVSSFWTGGFETLLRTGPFTLQGEYLATHVDRQNAPSLSFPGWYAQAGWSLTGEQRKYAAATGTLGGLTPEHPLSSGGWGAWELAMRYSSLDLNDGGINGGFERNVSVGVNWYPEKALKFMLDSIRVLPVRGGPEPDLSTTIWMLRMQAAY